MNQPLNLSGKTVVVTGAAGTLCSEISIDLSALGAYMVLIGRTAEKLQNVAEQIRQQGGRCRIETGDVTDEGRMQEIAVALNKEGKTCHILINGAGGNQNAAVTKNVSYVDGELDIDTGKACNGFFAMDMEIFQSVLFANTIGTVIPCRVFGAQMIKAGGGSIINFASMNSYKPLSRVPAYAMSKAGIVNFTEWLAAYLAPANIRVNAIAPGFFVNERSSKILMTPDGILTERGSHVMNHTPAGRFGKAADLTGCVRWLIDEDAAGFVTGITIPVDGGFQAVSGV